MKVCSKVYILFNCTVWLTKTIENRLVITWGWAWGWVYYKVIKGSKGCVSNKIILYFSIFPCIFTWFLAFMIFVCFYVTLVAVLLYVMCLFLLLPSGFSLCLIFSQTHAVSISFIKVIFGVFEFGGFQEF